MTEQLEMQIRSIVRDEMAHQAASRGDTVERLRADNHELRKQLESSQLVIKDLQQRLEHNRAGLEQSHERLSTVRAERDELQARLTHGVHVLTTRAERLDDRPELHAVADALRNKAAAEAGGQQAPGWSYAERKVLPADEHEKQMLKNGPSEPWLATNE